MSSRIWGKIEFMKLYFIKIIRYILARKVFYRLNLHLYKLSLRNIGILNSDSTNASGEDNLLKILAEKMDVKVSFDVGANEGGYAKLIQKYIPETEIYCFEPGEKAYEKLKRKRSSKIHVFRIGISDKNGKAKFYDFDEKSNLNERYPVGAMASLYKNVFTDLHREKPKSVKIEINTIDRFVKSQNIKQIDYLKIDTEGAELDVLKGAKHAINSNMIKVIHFEFNEMNVYSRVFLKDFIELLDQYNFYRLMPNGFFPLSNYSPKTHEIFAYQNIVAIRKSVDWN